MKILGIDYGLSNIGLSLAETPLAEPFDQLKYSSMKDLISSLSKIINDQQISLIVLGWPDGSLRPKIKSFSKELFRSTKIPVVFQDETFSTKQAVKKLIQANAPQKKRRQDHSAAAAFILQEYLDEHPQS